MIYAAWKSFKDLGCKVPGADKQKIEDAAALEQVAPGRRHEEIISEAKKAVPSTSLKEDVFLVPRVSLLF
jgi:hypothetical protein